MFRVKVQGTYVARSGVMEKEKIKKNYEITGNIPTTVAALSIVKNKLLGPALIAKYPDYVTFLTYNIIEIEPLDEASRTQMNNSEIGFMDRTALLSYIKDNNVGACSFEVEKGKPEQSFPRMDPVYYPDLFKLREAVQFARDDPKGYHKHFAIHESDLRLDLEMAKCNPKLFNQKAPEGFIAGVNLKPTGSAAGVALSSSGAALASRKASDPAALETKIEDRVSGLAADMTRDGELAPLDEAPPDVGDL